MIVDREDKVATRIVPIAGAGSPPSAATRALVWLLRVLITDRSFWSVRVRFAVAFACDLIVTKGPMRATIEGETYVI